MSGEGIIALAKTLRDQGCHYLWGAAGASPGDSNGAKYRPSSVAFAPENKDPSFACIRAAVTDVAGHCICAGRYKNMLQGGGRPASPDDNDLVNYLNGDTSQNFYDYYTPRWAQGGGITRTLVWGEDCTGIQHFDCVGFVNYCVGNNTTRTDGWPSYSIEQWNNDISGTSAVPLTSTLQPGDILIRASNGIYHHIGFYAGDGQTVEAMSPEMGVEIGAFSPSNWSSARRIAPYLLSSTET